MKDNMGTVLRSVITSMNLTISTMEKMNVTSNKIDLSGSFESAKREIGVAITELDKMDAEIAKASVEQEKYNNKLSVTSSSAGQLKTIFASLGGAVALKELIKTSDTWVQTTARLNLINDGLQTTAELQRNIYNAAQNSRVAYTDMASSVAKLGLLAGNSFSSTKEIIKFVDIYNKMGTISGSSTTEISNALYQLNQAMASGRLQGDEYRSIIENASMLASAIASYMDVGTDKLKQLASDGKITSDVIKNAMFSVSSEVEKQFKKMPMTWSQVWVNVQNEILILSQPLLDFINLLAQNWSKLKPIVIVVVAAIGTYLFILGAVSLANGIAALAEDIKTAAMIRAKKHTLAEAAATTTATGAQIGLNTALLACPLTWIITLIVVLIVLIAIFFEQVVGAIWWVGALGKNIGLFFANLGLAAWEVIQNIWLWLGNLASATWAIIQNVGTWFKNLGLGVWEALKTCCSNIGTAFSNAWLDIQIGWISAVKGIKEGAIDAIYWLNKIPGVKIDTSGIVDDVNKYTNEMAKLEASKRKYENIGDAFNKGFDTYKYKDVGDAFNKNNIDWKTSTKEAYGTFEPFKDGWGSDAYNSGAEIGRNLKDSVMGIFDITNDMLSGDDLTGILDEQEYDVNVNNDVNLADESLKYLLDDVTQKYINNINLLAPAPNVEVKIDVANGSDLDLDELAELTKKKIGTDIIEYTESSTDIRRG